MKWLRCWFLLRFSRFQQHLQSAHFIWAACRTSQRRKESLCSRDHGDWNHPCSLPLSLFLESHRSSQSLRPRRRLAVPRMQLQVRNPTEPVAVPSPGASLRYLQSKRSRSVSAASGSTRQAQLHLLPTGLHRVARMREKEMTRERLVWPTPNTRASSGAMSFPATRYTPATAAPEREREQSPGQPPPTRVERNR